MGIRIEESDDWTAIHSICDPAFGQPAEADLVQRLSADGDLMLSLMAYADSGQPVGHVAFSNLVLADCSPIRACALAPLAVAPAHQNQGIGTALVRESLKRLTEAGFDLAVVLGDPNYYGRFGFTPQLAQRLRTPYDAPHLQTLALSGRGRDAHGRASYARAFAELS